MNWKPWLHGLISAAINGAAMAITSAFVLPQDVVCFAVLGKLAAAGAVLGTANHLRKSPLPPKE